MTAEATALRPPIPSVVIKVPPHGPAHLPGARLLAVLAHPPGSQTDSRWQLAERALGRLVYLAHEAGAPGWSRQPQNVIPDHLTLTEPQAFAEHARLHALLDHRMGAAHAVIPFFRDALRARAQQSVRQQEVTVDDVVLRTLEQELQRRETLSAGGIKVTSRLPEQVHNFENRVLRPSLPVIHLAVAVALAVDHSTRVARGLPPDALTDIREDVAGPQISFADILARPDLARSIIGNAAELAELLPFLRRAKPKQMVKLVESRGGLTTLAAQTPA